MPIVLTSLPNSALGSSVESQIQSFAPFFSECTFIKRRDITGDPHSLYRANRDFLHLVFWSLIITAAMKVLGFADKTSASTNCNKTLQHFGDQSRGWGGKRRLTRSGIGYHMVPSFQQVWTNKDCMCFLHIA